MARKRKMYLLERIKDSVDWPQGATIWSDCRCPGWRVVRSMEVNI